MKLGEYLRRHATLTSVSRTRAEDGIRIEANGGSAAELNERVKTKTAAVYSAMRDLEETLGL